MTATATRPRTVRITLTITDGKGRAKEYAVRPEHGPREGEDGPLARAWWLEAVRPPTHGPRGYWIVDQYADGWFCSCPGFAKSHAPCKHVRAFLAAREAMVLTQRGHRYGVG